MIVERLRRRLGHLWLLVGIFAVVVFAAWFDGGEEALHPITQEIEVPENVE